MRPIIKVENLSKQYRIGASQAPYKTLRETISETLLSPFNGFRRNGKSGDSTIWALKDVSFEAHPGEVIGIIGRNGAGKSTLLKILSRITEPTVGKIDLYGRVGSLLEVGTGFHPELTGRENIYLNGAILGMQRREIAQKFDEIVAFAEIETFLDTPVKHYSSGMYVRLAFAVAAYMQPDILLVDEVLAVGDAAFQKKCLGKMEEVASKGRTVVFVSHNMAMISHLCVKGIVLSGGRFAFRGDAGEAIEYYNRSLLATDEDSGGDAPHIVFQNVSADEASDFAINRIEILDEAGQPKPITSTLDSLVIRVTYTSRKVVRRGSVVLHLSAYDGSKVLLLSTQPDGTLPLEFQAATQSVECVIERLPLAAGEYFLSAGLAIPNMEWLHWRQNIGRLSIVPHDVYGSGLAPVASRSLIAVEHHWRVAQ